MRPCRGAWAAVLLAALSGCGEPEFAPPPSEYMPEDYDHESYLAETRSACCEDIVSGTEGAGGSAEGCGDEICEMAVAEMAPLVRSKRGRVVLVMIYLSTCPRSQAVFEQLVPLAEELGDERHAFLVMAYDEDRGQLSDFLQGRRLPFAGLRLLPWASGELGDALESLDIVFGEVDGIPIVVVLDEDGSMIDSWTPAYDLDIFDIRAALDQGAQQ